MTTKEELQKQIDELQAKLDAMPDDNKLPGRWEPEIGEKYYVISPFGMIIRYIRDNLSDLSGAIAIDSIHKTKEEAKKALEQKLATVRVLDRIAELNAEQDWVCDWDDGEDKYYFGFDGDLCWAITDSFKVMPTQYYGSLKTIETVTKEMPEDCKLMLGVA